jgi:hypothetical protein
MYLGLWLSMLRIAWGRHKPYSPQYLYQVKLLFQDTEATIIRAMVFITHFKEVACPSSARICSFLQVVKSVSYFIYCWIDWCIIFSPFLMWKHLKIINIIISYIVGSYIRYILCFKYRKALEMRSKHIVSSN